MKLIDKKDIQFIDGRFLYGDETVMFEQAIGPWLNEIENLYQRALYEIGKNETAESLMKLRNSEFKFESAFDDCKLEFEAETPLLDERVEHSKAIMKELDCMLVAEKANKIAQYLRAERIVKWIKSDKVFVELSSNCVQVDTKHLGNPLELTEERLADVIATIAEASVARGDGWLDF